MDKIVAIVIFPSAIHHNKESPMKISGCLIKNSFFTCSRNWRYMRIHSVIFAAFGRVDISRKLFNCIPRLRSALGRSRGSGLIPPVALFYFSEIIRTIRHPFRLYSFPLFRNASQAFQARLFSGHCLCRQNEIARSPKSFRSRDFSMLPRSG